MSLAEKLIKAYKVSSPLSYSESNGADAIAWANKILRQLEEKSETVEFKAAPPTPSAPVKQKTCKKGFACGGSCIAKGRECKQRLGADAVKAADYLDEKIDASKKKSSASKLKKNDGGGDDVKKKGDLQSPNLSLTTPEERKQFIKNRPEAKSKLKSIAKVMKQIPGAPPPHPEELVALQEYTGLHYGPINAVLRGNDRDILAKPLTDKQREKYLEDARFASAALDALPDYAGTVYRGAALPKKIIDQYEVGKTITEKAFTSTSTKPNVAEGFESSGDGQTAIRYSIQSKRGKSVKALSAVSEEEEILFNSNTQFKVLGKKTKKGVVHIYLEEV